MNIGYFPGCSLTGTSKEYDYSLREVLKKLDVDLQEIKDWSCCGASSAHVTNHLLSIALPARNLLLAHKQQIKDIMAPCAACYNRLLAAQTEINSHPDLKKKVEYVLEEPFTDGANIMNIIQLFQKIGIERIAEKRIADLSGMKVVCYYGCLLVRPSALVKFDDAEQPSSMEALVTATGAKPVEWNFKTECCGAAHSIARTDIVVSLSKKILDDAEAHEADAIIVACPMCHSNLDMRQLNIMKQYSGRKKLPVLFLSELIGLSLGIGHKELGLGQHMIDPEPMLARTAKKEVTV